jgi:hypothetical protein
MHETDPKHGYRPIAWHRVFWDLTCDYEPLRLALKMHDPFCGRDQELCDRICSHYPGVDGTSRPVIVRRRQVLESASKQIIVSRYKEKFCLRLEIMRIDPPQRRIRRQITLEDK